MKPHLTLKVKDFTIIIDPYANEQLLDPYKLKDGSVKTFENLEKGELMVMPSSFSYVIKKLDLERKLMLVGVQPLDANTTGVLYLVESDNITIVGSDKSSVRDLFTGGLNNPYKFLKAAEKIGVKLSSDLSALYSPHKLGSPNNIINVSTKVVSGELSYTIQGDCVYRTKEKFELDDFIYG